MPSPPPAHPTVLHRAGRILRVLGGFAFSTYIDRRKRRISTKDAAKRLREALEKLGPIFVKFGQFLSLRPEFLPWEYCDELFLLLENVPPFSSAEVEQIFREEFGKPPQKIFAHFEAAPFASASLGQVHLAQFPNGEKLAVKVQRPGMHAVISQDLKLMRFFARILDGLYLSPFRFSPLLTEFQQWIFEELDYDMELKSAEKFRKETRVSNYLMTIPRFFPDFSTGRVLTGEFIPGISFNQILRAMRQKNSTVLRRARKIGFTPQKAGDLLMRTSLPQFFRSGCFHADPHPANLIFTEEGKIAYIDFGVLGEMDARLRLISLRYARSVLLGDEKTAFECYLLYNDVSRVRDLHSLQRAHDALVRLHQLRSKGQNGTAHFLGKFLFDGVRISERYRAVVPLNVLKAFRAISMFESVLFSIDPEMTVAKLARRLRNFSFATALEKTGEALFDPQQLENFLLNLLLAWEERELR